MPRLTRSHPAPITAIVGHLKDKIIKLTYFKGDGEEITRRYTLNQAIIQAQTGEDVELKPNAGTQQITAWDVDGRQWKNVNLESTQWDTAEDINEDTVPEFAMSKLQKEMRGLKVQLGTTVVYKAGGSKLGTFSLNAEWYVERAKQHIKQTRTIIDSLYDLTKTPDRFALENIVYKLWQQMKTKLNADDLSFGKGYFSIKDAEMEAVRKIAQLFRK